jgi:hypothetical protein
LLEKARKCTAADSSHEIFQNLCAGLPPEQGAAFKRIFDVLLVERLRTILQDSDLARATVGMPPVQNADDEQQAAEEIATLGVESRKKQRVVETKNDLVERHNLKKMKAAEKVETMKSLWASYGKDKSMTPGAKSFVSKHLTPMMGCLMNHFNGSGEAFLETYPEFMHTTFPKCCTGRGTSCNKPV